MTEFQVLGPITASHDGAPLALGGPRQRVLLALLLLESGRPVPVDRLADELWHGEPPDGARTTVRAYISKLRSTLGPDAPITSMPAGYALQVMVDRLDSVRFERLAAEGHAALVGGATSRAAGLLRAALELWRGHPFAGLADDGALQVEAQRLEELRLSTVEDRIEADLALGQGVELVDELEALVRDNPYRERLWRELMLALYRSERQADALAAFHRARALLDEELGLEPGEEISLLEQAILRHDVPPARPPAERHNLPAPISSFVGRGTELADIERLLGDGRLLTLVGVGGVGKTRLAIEAAARAVPHSPDGVFFVDLSALTEPALVPRLVATALDVPEHQETHLRDHLLARLRDAELLLVLDNCEHLREACAELCGRLLASSPRLRVLATSRESLGLPGETAYPVPPLALPRTDADPNELRASEAVLLFLARANEAAPRSSDGPATLETAARICRGLDGLPLAIELAAARTRAFSLEEIATRLADRFQFLVSWRRLTPARHRTLSATMDWSYDLLADDERVLLDRLSVFAGGFTLAAVTSVCLEGKDSDAVDLVGRLVDASLVVAEERSGETRYRLLETVRQYAAERLDVRGEASDVRRRHAEHFLTVADAVWLLLRRGDDAEYMERLVADPDNLRAAREWSRQSGQIDLELRLAKALWWFWYRRGDVSESREWLEAAIGRGEGVDPGLRAHVLEGAAGLAWVQGDLDRARELAAAALPLFAAVGDRRGEASCTNTLGLAALTRQDFRAAEEFFERYRVLAEGLGDDLGGRFAVARALDNLGSVALEEGNLERAVDRYGAARHVNEEIGDREGVAFNELHLAFVAIETGDENAAAAHLGGALPVYRELGFLQYTADCLEAAAAIARARGAAREAVRLIAAAQLMRERTGIPAMGMRARLREHGIAATRTELGESAFGTGWSAGRSLREEEAFDLAQVVVEG